MADHLRTVGHQVELRSTTADDQPIVEDDFDVIVVQGRSLLDHRHLHRSATPMIVDLYDPFLLEALHRGGDDPIRRADLIEGARRTLVDQLARGDFFLAASERQRDFWLGWLASVGRINAATHAADPELRHLIDTVPFGIDPTAAAASDTPLADAHGLDPADPIVLWAGGLHDWLDPLTVVRAIDRVRAVIPDVRLVLLGAHHPDPEHDEPATLAAIRAEVEQRGLADHVLLHPTWLPYAQRGAALGEARVGVTAQQADIEARFSFRTRLLDHAWAGLPTVATGGDELADYFASVGAAHLAAPGDDAAFAGALIEFLSDPDAHAAAAAATAGPRSRYRWSDALVPVLDFVATPRRAPDLLDATLAPGIESRRPEIPRGVSRAVERAQVHLRSGGPRALVSKSLKAAGRTVQTARGRSAPRP
ncbi:MAG: glycosyltransferase [Acidimicrobiales bacterium]|nr:glycosyltransferase [Acidimicrobiales bacterium]